MTALEKYARLIGSGVWRAGPDAQRRDVVVSLGDSSLIIKDARSDHALSHWSLPAVQRRNRGTTPALYVPSADDDGESLEIDDALLIEALETIRAALMPKPPLRWLRLGLAGGVAALVIAGALWLPGVLVRRTAALVPPAVRVEIGREALGSLFESATTERVCADPQGRQALATLRNRVLGNDWRVSVVAGVPGFEATHLPGQMIVLGEDLVARLDSGEALAGWLVAEAQAQQAIDPLIDALHFAGTRATVRLLTSGALPEGAMRGYIDRRMSLPPAMPDADGLAIQLESLGIAPTAYALSLPADRAALAQALADHPINATRSVERLLSDGEWLTVQAICTN